MYNLTLSLTAENILVFLLGDLGKEYSIREISKAIGQDYKIVFITIQCLVKTDVIGIKKVSNISRCSLKLTKENIAVFAYVSERKAREALSKKIVGILYEVVLSIDDPFYSLLVFGSYAKGAAGPASDIDLLVITPNKDSGSDILPAIKKAATLNNARLNPVFLTAKEFQAGLKEPGVAKEAYKNHLLFYGGASFYSLISHD